MGLFNNYNKVGPGVSKNAPEKHRFFLFFELFGRKFTKLVLLNLIYLAALIPLILGLRLSLTLNLDNIIKQPLISFTGDIIGIALLIIAGFITGPATAGFTYVIRNFQREEHAWVWSDFKEHFKKNFKQGVAMTFIDYAAYFLLYVAFVFYIYGAGALAPSIAKASPYLSAVIVLLSIIYTWAHYYIYVMMVTFDLKLKDIIKNAIIFAFAKLPLNILISVILIVLSFAMLYYIAIGAILFIIFGFSLFGYIITFCVYPTIDKLMIKPQNHDDGDNGPGSDFSDELII